AGPGARRRAPGRLGVAAPTHPRARLVRPRRPADRPEDRMTSRASRRPGAWLVTTVTAALAVGTVGAATTAAAADDPGGAASPAPTAAPRPLGKDAKILGGLGTLSGTRSVFVQLAGDGAADAAAAATGTTA